MGFAAPLEMECVIENGPPRARHPEGGKEEEEGWFAT